MIGRNFHMINELFQNNFIHVTHTDMDGYGCSVVVAVAKETGLIRADVEYHTINIGYPGKFVDAVEEFTAKHPETATWPILITDLNANDQIIDYLEETGVPFVLIDHHVTDMKLVTRIKALSMASRISTLDSATRLLFNQCGFYNLGAYYHNIVTNLGYYTLEVSKYDTGNWGSWNADSILSTSAALREQLLFMGTPVDDYVAEVTKQIMLNTNRDLYSMDAVNRQFSLLATYQHLFNSNLMEVDPDCLDKGPVRVNKAMAIPITLPYISIISKKYLEEHRDVDMLIILGNKHGNISLRSIDFNVQQLAAAYGGGGHPRAAGFPIENMELTVSFGRRGRRPDTEFVMHPAPILDEKNDKNTN